MLPNFSVGALSDPSAPNAPAVPDCLASFDQTVALPDTLADADVLGATFLGSLRIQPDATDTLQASITYLELLQSLGLQGIAGDEQEGVTGKISSDDMSALDVPIVDPPGGFMVLCRS